MTTKEQNKNNNKNNDLDNYLDLYTLAKTTLAKRKIDRFLVAVQKNIYTPQEVDDLKSDLMKTIPLYNGVIKLTNKTDNPLIIKPGSLHISSKNFLEYAPLFDVYRSFKSPAEKLYDKRTDANYKKRKKWFILGSAAATFSIGFFASFVFGEPLSYSMLSATILGAQGVPIGNGLARLKLVKEYNQKKDLFRLGLDRNYN